MTDNPHYRRPRRRRPVRQLPRRPVRGQTRKQRPPGDAPSPHEVIQRSSVPQLTDPHDPEACRKFRREIREWVARRERQRQRDLELWHRFLEEERLNGVPQPQPQAIRNTDDVRQYLRDRAAREERFMRRYAEWQKEEADEQPAADAD